MKRQKVLIANVDGKFVPVHTKTATICGLWRTEVKAVSLREMAERMTETERQAILDRKAARKAEAAERAALRKEAERIVNERNRIEAEKAYAAKFQEAYS